VVVDQMAPVSDDAWREDLLRSASARRS